MALIPPIHGVRVLRGPDWRVDDDTDGGEGHLGTVQGSHVDGTVDVLWDMGQETRCRAGQEGKFDLRILDTATVGVRHPGTCCTECEEQDIWGVLWRCQQCVASDLCSTCYNDDKHDLRHRFLRIDFPGAAGRLMKKRNVSVRIRSVGIFPGAKVVRGKNWEWKDQDGGEGSEGEVVEILNTASQHGNRNLVRVLWPSGKNDVYRLAYEGHVDVTCTDEEAGGFYYRDHLPCLDTAQFSTRKTTSSSPQGGNAEQVSPESAGVVDPHSADHDADNPSQTTDIADTTEDQHRTPGSPADDTTLPTSPLVSAITMDKLAEPSPHSHASHEIRRFLTATAGTSADHASGENAVESDLQDRSKSREERCHNPSEVDGDQQLARTEDMTPSDSAASCTEHSVQHLPAGDTGSGSVAMGSSETAADSETGTLPSGRRPEEPRSDCERRSSPQHSADPDRNGEVASCGATHRVTPPANQPPDTSEVSLPDTPSGAEANMDTGTKDDVSLGDKKDPAETVMSEKTDSQDSVAETTDSAGLVTVSEDKVDAVDAHTPARIQSCSQETRRETDGTDTMDHGRQGTDRAEDASQDLPPVCEKGLPDQTTEGNDCATSAVLGNDGTTPDIATGPQVPDTTMATSESGDLTDQTSAVGEVCDRKSDDPRHSSDVPMDQNGHLSSPDQGYLTSPEQGHLTSPEQGYLTSPEQTPSPQTQTTKGGTLDATEETPPTRDTTERKSPEFSEDLKTPATAPTSEIPETSQTLSSTHPPSAELLSARARSEPSDEELGATAAAPDTNVADSGPVPVSFFLKDTDPTEEITNEAGGGGQGGGFATDGENLMVGDTAVIAVPEVTLKELQAGYGGTTRRMIKKIGVEGKVAKVLPSGAVHLRLGKVVYRVNPDALVKTYPYNVGDTVRIREDLYLVRVLNHRIQWPNRMDQTAGKVGEVTRVDNDGDLRVRFGQCSYLYTPGCCVPAPGCSVDRVEERGSSLDIGSLMEESGDGDASSLLGRLTGLLSTGGGGGDGGGGGRGGRGHRIRLSDVAQLAQAGDDLDDQLRTLGSLNQQLGSLIRGAGGTMGGITLGGGGEDSAEGRLQMAVMEGDVDKVKAMCRADPRLVEREHNGVTPLMLASHEGRRKVVWALLDLGADINAGGAKEQCPLISALDRKKEDIALLLLERGASARQRNALQRTPLHCAVFNYQNEAAQMLLYMGSDVNAQDKHGDTPLHDCISRQNTVMVDLLLHQEGLNLGLVNKRGFTPLQLACMRENAQMLCLLLAKDSSSVNQLIDNDLAALHVCVKGRFLEGVRVLLSHGSADVNLPSGHRRQTALHMACLQGSTDLVQALVDIGASLNVQDRNGDTPLHMAMGGCDKSITSSQEREADIQTRIQIACQLISHGAFVDARNRKGKPPTVFGHDGTMAGVARFIARNPGLVRYKGRGDRATEAEGTGGRLQSSSVMTLREDVSMTCALCGGESDVTLRPCGHRCVCRTCADILMFCPLCDASVQSKEVQGRGAAAASPPHTRSQDTGSQPPASLNQSLSADTKDPDTSFRMNNRAMDDVTEEQEASTQDSRDHQNVQCLARRPITMGLIVSPQTCHHLL
ncbi:uncharacterized protein LOC143287678 [Babylonia areolata]|uniref:uncharacterized protein LOC143287678 n=1 Tax=Babylonia areolata TaxID=304850 RepID=UPI003FD07138